MEYNNLWKETKRAHPNDESLKLQPIIEAAIRNLFTGKFKITVGLEAHGGDPILASPIDSPSTEPENTVPQQSNNDRLHQYGSLIMQ